MSDIEKLPLTSMNITAAQIAKLKELFPEAFTEGSRVDWDKLRLTLGETIDVGKERFGMNWPGKADCFKAIQQPSTATLIPARDESVNFDTTENLFIEGDNLEVLKLLQKSYLGKIKMMYFDPPYNTGNDFIYPDNYSESLDTYLEYTGQVDSEGRKFSTNTDTDGRFHSKWMNMMYPRLFLAKNLLKEDGIIFISIDDNEVKNLRSLCDEIFGEENFIAQLIWNLRSGSQAGQFTGSHEYILAFTKSFESLKYFSDIDGGSIIHGALKKISKDNPESEITFPAGMEFEGINKEFEGELGGSEKQIIVSKKMIFRDGVLQSPVTLRAGWAMKNQIESWIAGKETFDSKGQKVIRFFFNSQGILWYEKERGTVHPKTVLPDEVGNTKTGSGELIDIMGSKILDFPKPSTLIKFLTKVATNKDDLVLDIFAGSCTTAHSILEINKQDSGNRKFICVQLPEPTDENSEAYKAGFKTIADIGKERIRRVIKKISLEVEEKTEKENGAPKLFENEEKPIINNQDLGFKVLKLAKSNFSSWNADVEKTPEAIQEQLFKHVQHISTEAEQEAILYELLLKSGFELTTPIKKLELEGKQVFSIGENELLLCLEKQLTHELIKAMAELKPIRIICLDAGFQNNDQLKTNAALIMKSKGVVKFQTV
jgi:adenine-specific DNA-methyltransferase